MEIQTKVVNLGCGHKVSAHPSVLNIDWSIYLRIRESRLLTLLSPLLLSSKQKERFDQLPLNIMAHDLGKGIPLPDNSADVIFHSNMMEHLDRSVAENFLLEALRVLKPGGIHRIVVPDFEKACANYLAHIAACDSNPNECARHEDYIARIIEQSVRREAAGTRLQRPVRRFIENVLLGDARRRGETHQWMYDRISLVELLQRLGYKNVSLKSYDTSDISSWAQYVLDTNADGSEYAPGSLYIEASK
jgi:SAM-dependent methyltransferase